MQLANMPFVGCSKALEYFCRLREGISVDIEVVGEFDVRHWYFDKPYADM